MRAVQFQGVNQLALADVDRPRIGEDEVLVSLRSVGICHSDFELLEGRYIIPIAYPIIPGHEWAGEVVEVGSAVRDLREAVVAQQDSFDGRRPEVFAVHS